MTQAKQTSAADAARLVWNALGDAGADGLGLRELPRATGLTGVQVRQAIDSLRTSTSHVEIGDDGFG